MRFLLCAMMLISFASCSDQNGKDDPDDPGFETGIPTEVRITLSSRSGNQTRADGGKPKDPNASIEYIHDWWIVFVDTKGNKTVLKRDDAKDKGHTVTGGSTNQGTPPNDGFEVETFKTTIPTGTYDIYAFANIGYSDENLSYFVNSLANARKNTTSKDAAITAIKEAMKAISLNSTFKSDNMTWDKNSNIPMTGYILGAQVKNTVEETFSIEVIRTVAKVEFSFTNPSNDNITLQTLEFRPITTANLSLFPDYSVIGIKENDALKGLSTDKLTFENLSTLVVENDKYTLGVLDFYCKETLPPDGGFDIKLNVTRNGESKDYTYRTTTITYINRNDWIHIPIKFNDWIIIWKLHYYPPIGGYPPVFYQNDDGTSLAATLTTGGEFELYPYQIKKNSEDADYYNDVDWDKVEISSLTDAEKNLFVADKTPTVMVNPNYNVTGHPLKDLPKIITGEFKPTEEGRVDIKFIFYLKNTDNKYPNFQYATTKLDCTFTVTRKNGS